MLQNIRDNAQGTIAKIIVGLIILTFAVFGTDAIIQSFYGEPEAAQVNGEPITQVEFEQLVERKRRQLFNQMGPEFDPASIDQNALRQAALDEAIQRKVLLQAADRMGVKISDAQVDAFILQWPAAQEDGQFSPDRYRSLLASIGLTPLSFRAELAQELAAAQLQSGVVQSAFLPDPELLELLRLERQTRDFRFVTFQAVDRVDEASVSAEDIQAYYESNLEQFREPNRVVLDYIEVNKGDLAETLELDEAELESQYQAELAAFESSERRQASHLLIEVNDERSDEEALARIEEIRAEIDAGRTFKDAASEFSEDLGTRIDGGDLGLVSRGVLDDASLEDALFALNEGELSQPVRSDYGYHLIALNSIQTSEPPSREEAMERLAAEQRRALAESRFIELSTELTDLTYSAPDLQEAAEALSLSIQRSPELREGEPSSDPVWSHPRVVEQAFSVDLLEEGHNSEVIEVTRDKLVVLRSQEYQPSEIPSLDSLEADIRKRLALQSARDGLSQEVAAIIESEDVESRENLNWESVLEAGRSQEDYAAETALAFQLPQPAEGETSLRAFDLEDAVVLVELTRVTDPDMDSLKELKGIVGPLMGSRIGGMEYDVFMQGLRHTADIQRNP